MNIAMKNEQIYTFGHYLRNKYQKKVFKTAVSVPGFTCPNIDGTVARGGCTFCENDSFSPSLNKTQSLKGFHLNLDSTQNPLLRKQLTEIKEQFASLSQTQQKRYGAEAFLLYFQSFTNTYAPFSTLKALYDEALDQNDVIGLSIGTRSDSITQETLDYLKVLTQRHEIWLEFGIQSVYNSTLERINRGHSSANVKEWILRAKDAGINVCGHLIFGLPQESQEMMLETAQAAYSWGIDSVKYHPLYVVGRTALANEFNQGTFTPITQEHYIDVLVEAIKMKPHNVSVQRVTAGIDNESLIAPQWCKDKNEQIRAINEQLKKYHLKY